MAEEAVRKVQEEQQQADRPLVPGWEQICNICPYKDFHQTFKNSSALMQELQRQTKLVRNLSAQLQVATSEAEMLRKKYEPEEEEEVEEEDSEEESE